jgi:hypothetical protein
MKNWNSSAAPGLIGPGSYISATEAVVTQESFQISLLNGFRSQDHLLIVRQPYTLSVKNMSPDN